MLVLEFSLESSRGNIPEKELGEKKRTEKKKTTPAEVLLSVAVSSSPAVLAPTVRSLESLALASHQGDRSR